MAPDANHCGSHNDAAPQVDGALCLAVALVFWTVVEATAFAAPECLAKFGLLNYLLCSMLVKAWQDCSEFDIEEAH